MPFLFQLILCSCSHVPYSTRLCCCCFQALLSALHLLVAWRNENLAVPSQAYRGKVPPGFWDIWRWALSCWREVSWIPLSPHMPVTYIIGIALPLLILYNSSSACDVQIRTNKIIGALLLVWVGGGGPVAGRSDCDRSRSSVSPPPEAFFFLPSIQPCDFHTQHRNGFTFSPQAFFFLWP